MKILYCVLLVFYITKKTTEMKISEAELIEEKLFKQVVMFLILTNNKYLIKYLSSNS